MDERGGKNQILIAVMLWGDRSEFQFTRSFCQSCARVSLSVGSTLLYTLIYLCSVCRMDRDHFRSPPETYKSDVCVSVCVCGSVWLQCCELYSFLSRNPVMTCDHHAGEISSQEILWFPFDPLKAGESEWTFASCSCRGEKSHNQKYVQTYC